MPKPGKVLKQLFRNTCMKVASDLRLSVSVPKTKLMVSGREATAEDYLLLVLLHPTLFGAEH